MIHLANLSQEELYLLLEKLRNVYASGDPEAYLVPDEALRAFMVHCSERIGDAYFRTPRNTIKAFLDLLAVLDQNPEASWEELVGRVQVEQEENPDLRPLEDEEAASGSEDAGLDDGRGEDDELASFTL